MVFGKLFGANKTPIIGVDVAQDFIIITKIKKEDNKFKVQNLIKIPTPEGSVIGSNILQAELLGDLIRKTLNDNEISDVRVNLSIPVGLPFVRTLALPDLPFEELKLIAQDEASNQIPFPIAEANVDYALLTDSKRVVDNKKSIDVLIVAIQKNIVQKYLDLADTAKVKINSIEAASFSAIKVLANSEQIKDDKNLDVCVVVGFDHTDILIVSKGMPLFLHSTPIGKKNIIESISSGLGMDIKTANEFIPQVAILVPGVNSSNDPQIVKAATLVRMIYNNITTEISKAIQFYKSQKSNMPEISKIFITGSGSSIKNVDKFIANRLKIETEYANSYKNLVINPDIVENNDPSTVAISIGLALKGL